MLTIWRLCCCMQADQMFPVPLSWMVDETGQDLDDFAGFNFEHCGQASAQLPTVAEADSILQRFTRSSVGSLPH